MSSRAQRGIWLVPRWCPEEQIPRCARDDSPASEPSSAFARKLLQQGVANQEILIKHGLSEKLLDDLKAGVDQFDALVSASNDGLLGHVMARSALQRVSDEIMQLVEIIDGINRYRFAGQPELLAAWDSARHVVTGPRTAEEDAEDRPTSPGAGEVQTAA